MNLLNFHQFERVATYIIRPLLNQACTANEIVFVRASVCVCVCVCVSVCVSTPRPLITSGMILCDIDCV